MRYFLLLLFSIEALASEKYGTGLNKPIDADFGVSNVSFKKEFLDHDELPKEYDLRDYGWVSPVRNQKSCGSCWSFSTIDSMESSMLMFGLKNIFLSTQHAVNCLFSGCGGGYFAFDWIKKNGITDNASLPYQASNGRCKNDYPTKYSVDSWWRIGPSNGSPTMEQVKAAVYHFGGVSVTIGSGGMENSGNTKSCRRASTDHMVTVVGWKVVDGKEKYIMKNSWSENWGDKGYTYIGHLCASVAEEAAVSIYKGVPVADMVPQVRLPQYVEKKAGMKTLSAPYYEDATYAWYVDGELKSIDTEVTFRPLLTREVKVVIENQFAKVESKSKVGRL